MFQVKYLYNSCKSNNPIPYDNGWTDILKYEISYVNLQLIVNCNLSYTIKGIFNYKYHLQLKNSCKNKL